MKSPGRFPKREREIVFNPRAPTVATKSAQGGGPRFCGESSMRLVDDESASLCHCGFDFDLTTSEVEDFGCEPRHGDRPSRSVKVLTQAFFKVASLQFRTEDAEGVVVFFSGVEDIDDLGLGPPEVRDDVDAAGELSAEVFDARRLDVGDVATLDASFSAEDVLPIARRDDGHMGESHHVRHDVEEVDADEG